MVVISIKELYLLKGFGAGGVTKDGGMHDQEQIQSSGSCKDRRGSEINSMKTQFPTISITKFNKLTTTTHQTGTQSILQIKLESQPTFKQR